MDIIKKIDNEILNIYYKKKFTIDYLNKDFNKKRLIKKENFHNKLSSEFDIKINFDGSCGPKNPGGDIGIAFIIEDKFGNVSYSYNEQISSKEFNYCTSSNLAEYLSLLIGLNYIYENYSIKGLKILVQGDSALVINQLLGYWRIKEGYYKEIATRVFIIINKFEYINFMWVPRDKNKETDLISKYNYDKNK
jgi:ribonuclease HI